MLRKVICYLFGLSAMAGLGAAEEPAVPPPSQLEALDAELDLLEDELHDTRLKAMQEEITSQPLMFEEWSEFAQHMKKSESLEDRVRSIKQRIQMLEVKRQQLIEGQSPQASEP